MTQSTRVIFKYKEDAPEFYTVVFSQPQAITPGVTPRPHRAIGRMMKGLFVGGILGLVVLLSPFLWVEARYRVSRLIDQPEKKAETIIANQPEVVSPTFAKLLNQKYLDILKPVDEQFSIVIPKLSINSRVIANVDAANSEEYTAALKLGAAHAKGTYLPDENGTTFIFAHSTDYVWNITRFNAVFYLLKELEDNDQVDLVYNGVVYPYVVVDKKIVDSDAIEYLTPHEGKQTLILQTCWPPGTTSKRLLIFAQSTYAIPRPKDISYSY